jgi:hypothetical protein
LCKNESISRKQYYAIAIAISGHPSYDYCSGREFRIGHPFITYKKVHRKYQFTVYQQYPTIALDSKPDCIASLTRNRPNNPRSLARSMVIWIGFQARIYFQYERFHVRLLLTLSQFKDIKTVRSVFPVLLYEDTKTP